MFPLKLIDCGRLEVCCGLWKCSNTLTTPYRPLPLPVGTKPQTPSEHLVSWQQQTRHSPQCKITAHNWCHYVPATRQTAHVMRCGCPHKGCFIVLCWIDAVAILLPLRCPELLKLCILNVWEAHHRHRNTIGMAKAISTAVPHKQYMSFTGQFFSSSAYSSNFFVSKDSPILLF